MAWEARVHRVSLRVTCVWGSASKRLTAGQAREPRPSGAKQEFPPDNAF